LKAQLKTTSVNGRKTVQHEIHKFWNIKALLYYIYLRIRGKQLSLLLFNFWLITLRPFEFRKSKKLEKSQGKHKPTTTLTSVHQLLTSLHWTRARGAEAVAVLENFTKKTTVQRATGTVSDNDIERRSTPFRAGSYPLGREGDLALVLPRLRINIITETL